LLADPSPDPVRGYLKGAEREAEGKVCSKTDKSVGHKPILWNIWLISEVWGDKNVLAGNYLLNLYRLKSILQEAKWYYLFLDYRCLYAGLYQDVSLDYFTNTNKGGVFRCLI
jgi:hypothetical protein